jgi:hypothetical protein
MELPHLRMHVVGGCASCPPLPGEASGPQEPPTCTSLNQHPPQPAGGCPLRGLMWTRGWTSRASATCRPSWSSTQGCASSTWCWVGGAWWCWLGGRAMCGGKGGGAGLRVELGLTRRWARQQAPHWRSKRHQAMTLRSSALQLPLPPLLPPPPAPPATQQSRPLLRQYIPSHPRPAPQASCQSRGSATRRSPPPGSSPLSSAFWPSSRRRWSSGGSALLSAQQCTACCSRATPPRLSALPASARSPRGCALSQRKQ